MNVLLYTYEAVRVNHGGTERISVSVAQALKAFYSINCYAAYSVGIPDLRDLPMFEGFVYCSLSTDDNYRMQEFLNEKKIDCIIIQGYFWAVPYFRKIIKTNGIKIYFAHHYAPVGELNSMTFVSYYRRMWFEIDRIKKLKDLIKCFIFPYLKRNKKKFLSRMYKLCYEYADKTILLSDRFEQSFANYGKITDFSKFVIIPNMLSFDFFATKEIIEHKQKKVLIVTRFDESQKRVLLALKIWENLMQNPLLNEWHLDLIGHGNDYQLCVDFAERKKIQNTHFLGKTDPIPFYRNASLFMMTSKSEAWGLTLTESQQMGVIPFAFDSYESLHDIIDDGQNGCIIPEMDLQCYISKMTQIMLDEQLRKTMAFNAINKSKRFSAENVAKLWYDLFKAR